MPSPSSHFVGYIELSYLTKDTWASSTREHLSMVLTFDLLIWSCLVVWSVPNLSPTLGRDALVHVYIDL